MSVPNQMFDLIGSNLRWAATETAIDGNQVIGQSEVAHDPILAVIHNRLNLLETPRAGCSFGVAKRTLVPLR